VTPFAAVVAGATGHASVAAIERVFRRVEHVLELEDVRMEG